MKLLIFQLLLTFTWMSNASNAQKLSPTVLKQLDKVETGMFKFISEGDSAAFKKLAGTDYYSINAHGADAELKTTLTGMLNFKGSEVKLSNQGERVYGNFVLRNGKAKFYFGGQPAAEVLYTTGWVARHCHQDSCILFLS